MASVTEYLNRLQNLTETNLEILQAINDSFFSKKDHLSVNINNTTYAIPSFLSLENKINYLKENFENLVHAPETGEAYFTFDGNSRAIQVRSYIQTPPGLVLPNVSNFQISKNDIFKDFLTPIPHITLSLSTLPNDITSVVVKKIIPRNNALLSFFQNKVGDNISISQSFSDLYKILLNYKKGEDYIEYDTIQKMPIRKNIGNSTYVIQTIIKDEVDTNLDNYITIKLRNNLEDPYSNTLTYKLFDETIEKNLSVGDELVTFDGSAKMVITELRPNTNVITVKVLNGEYLNLVESKDDDQISDLSKLRFYSPIDFDEDKYIQIPLEEDQYIFVSVAALNDRMNIQSPWGTGLMLNVYGLKNGEESFQTYYRENVKNIGDILYEITSMMDNNLTKFSKEEFSRLVSIKPIINKSDLLVHQINKHLNDSESIKNIRTLYSQKKEYQNKLNEIQEQITIKNDELATISFDDTTNMRSIYVSQLTNLVSQKNELINVINKTIDEISVAANNSEIPIENAKYRIRGFFNTVGFLKSIGKEFINEHVKGIQVQYRYKNHDSVQGNALSINDSFIFSDWNNLSTFQKVKTATYKDGYKFKLEEDNYNINEPSYNQIDIPISQGESVDIRLRIEFDYGSPFVQITSDWSDIVNIEFPDEFLKDVQITSILTENKLDLENNRFNDIINDKGIPNHIDDKVQDQDMIYFHKPENISSGFYTTERRIIPLKDKLSAMDATIIALQDEILGSQSDNISVSVMNGENSYALNPYQVNNISVAAYDVFSKTDDNTQEENDEVIDGNYVYKDKIVTVVLNIALTNTSDHTVKLYSMFPGSRSLTINELANIKSGLDIYDYVGDSKRELDDEDEKFEPKYGVWLNYFEDNEDKLSLQTANQFITFRIKDINDGTPYYVKNKWSQSGKTLSLEKDNTKYTSKKPGGDLAFMYPKIQDKYSLCLDSDNIGSYMTLSPGTIILIPIVFEYRIENQNTKSISKTMSFDLRTSLYKDPITYTFRVTAKHSSTAQDKAVAAGKNKVYNALKNGVSGLVKYKAIFK